MKERDPDDDGVDSVQRVQDIFGVDEEVAKEMLIRSVDINRNEPTEEEGDSHSRPPTK